MPITSTTIGSSKQSGLGNLLALALMWPQIRRQREEARQAREAVEQLRGMLRNPPQGEPVQTAAPTLAPEMFAPQPMAPLGVTAPRPLALAGRAMQPQIAQMGVGAGPAVAPLDAARGGYGGQAGQASLWPLGARRALTLEAAQPSGRAWVPGAKQGLEEMVSSPEWQAKAALAASYGRPEFAAMRPAAWTPSKGEQREAYQWGDLGGKERFTQEALTGRAQIGAASRVEIAEMRERGKVPEQLKLVLQYGSAESRALLESVEKERGAGDKLIEQMNIDGIDRSELAKWHYGEAERLAGRAMQMSVMELLRSRGGTGTAGGTAAEPQITQKPQIGGTAGPAPAGYGPDGKPLPGTPSGAVMSGAGVPVPPGVPTTLPTIAPPKVSRMDVQQGHALELEGVRQAGRLDLQRAAQAFKKANGSSGSAKQQAAAEGIAAFFGMEPAEAKQIAALSPSMQIAALKQRGIISPGDEKDVEALTRTMMSKVRLSRTDAKDPQKVAALTGQVHDVAAEMIKGWRAAPTATPAAAGGKGQSKPSGKREGWGQDFGVIRQRFGEATWAAFDAKRRELAAAGVTGPKQTQRIVSWARTAFKGTAVVDFLKGF